jgi:adenine phosphoribosyltransferase
LFCKTFSEKIKMILPFQFFPEKHFFAVKTKMVCYKERFVSDFLTCLVFFKRRERCKMIKDSAIEKIKAVIRDVPDFPKPGIIFKDITPILAEPKLFKDVVRLFAERHKNSNIDYVAAIEARGFILGGALACALNAGFIPIRKKGKLPYKTIEASYDLEYGTATIAMHIDAIKKGSNVLIVDDLLATGGTAFACASLIEQLGGKIVELDFLIELVFCKGREKLTNYPIYVPIKF